MRASYYSFNNYHPAQRCNRLRVSQPRCRYPHRYRTVRSAFRWPTRIAMPNELSLEQRKQITEQDYDKFIKSYPDVKDITATELKELLDAEPNKVVLVDVRTPEEREVSQLPGNVLTPDEFVARKAEFQGTDYLVVPYCTAGFRSGKFAANLTKDNLKVKNLKGSIIAWTQEGYPLVTGDGSKEPTKRVHAFGAKWAEQMGDGYELQTFNAAKGVLEITRTVLPKWLGGSSS